MKRDLLLELGTEEIPARFLPAARAALQDAATRDIESWTLTYDAIELQGTPRRTVLVIKGLEAKQADFAETVTGPPWDRAFIDGEPSKAAIGFAGKQGVDPADLQQIETSKGVFAGFTAQREGRQVTDLLTDAVPRWIDAMPFGKTMRWESTGIRFARPIRWLVLLYGEDIVDLTYAGLQSGRTTQGHRFHGEVFNAGSAEHYLQEIERQHVMLSSAQRRKEIVKQGSALAQAQDLTIDWDETLLDEVVDLIEWPTPLLADFDSAYLDLPDVVLEAPMKKHQRYFPVRDSRGRLTNRFLIVSNQPDDSSGLIANGNKRVLSARLADAKFFWDQDRQLSLDSHATALERITWQQGLGTLNHLTERTKRLALQMLDWLPGNEGLVRQVADLYLADLGTQMVGEFADLQGEIGAIYAKYHGLSDGLVQALREAHKPAGPEDNLPKSSEGTAVAIAHRIDLIVGNLVAGHEVSGSQDPYGMRRAAIGLFRIFSAIETRTTPAELSLILLEQYRNASYIEVAIPDDIADKIQTFWQNRLAAYIENLGSDAAIAKAVVAASHGHITGALARLNAISLHFEQQDKRDHFLDTYKRLRNISREQDPVSHDQLANWSDQETAFFATQILECDQALKQQLKIAMTPFPPDSITGDQAPDLLSTLLPLIDAAVNLFDDVTINTDDPAVTGQRKALVKTAQNCFDQIADFDLYISGVNT